MDIRPDETQTYLRDAVAGAVARHAASPTVRSWIDAANLSPADALAAEQGWTGIGLAEDLGGQGGGLQELVVVAEELGRAAVPWDRTLAGYVAATVLAEAGEAGRGWAASNAEGNRVAVLCLDPRDPLRATGVQVDDGLCKGSTSFVLGATAAAAYVLAQPLASGELDLFLVERGADGVEVSPRTLVDATRSLADVRFSGSPCLALGAVPATVWQTAVDAAVVLSCADSLGAASRLLEMTTEYVKDRKQFGVAVGSFQAVKHAAAQMLVDVEGSRSAVQYAAWALETAAADGSLHASVAGAFCSRTAPDVADRALFLHGAIGYTWEHDVQLLFKRVKSNAVLLGTVDWHRHRISDSLGWGPAAA